MMLEPLLSLLILGADRAESIHVAARLFPLRRRLKKNDLPSLTFCKCQRVVAGRKAQPPAKSGIGIYGACPAHDGLRDSRRRRFGLNGPAIGKGAARLSGGLGGLKNANAHGKTPRSRIRGQRPPMYPKTRFLSSPIIRCASGKACRDRAGSKAPQE